MRRHLTSLGLIVAIAVGWYLWRQRTLTPAVVPSSSSVMTQTGSGSGALVTRIVKPVERARQISRDDRERLLVQIAAAKAARGAGAAAAAAATATGSAPALPDEDHAHDLGQLGQPVLAALQQAIPFLASCYEQQGSAHAGDTAVAMMTLTNDRDIGAVIDADQIVDDKQAPLDPKVDACLRATMQTLQLPPLDAGDTVKMQYSFRF